MYDFPENQCWQGRTFLLGVNELTFTHVPVNHRTFKIKTVLVIRYGIHHVLSCLPTAMYMLQQVFNFNYALFQDCCIS